MTVYVYILPVLLRRLIYLVHYTEMRVRFRDSVPPFPSLAVQRTLCVPVDIIQGAEVRGCHNLVRCSTLAQRYPGRLTKVCEGT